MYVLLYRQHQKYVQKEVETYNGEGVQEESRGFEFGV